METEGRDDATWPLRSRLYGRSLSLSRPDSIPSRDISFTVCTTPMLIPTAWHSVLRPAYLACRSTTRIFPRNAQLHNTPSLRWRVSSVQNFHATDLLSATHRSAARRVRRDWKPPGPFKRLGRRLNAIPANYIIFGVLGINGVVFVAWSYAQMFQVRALVRHDAIRPSFPLSSNLRTPEHGSRVPHSPQDSPYVSKPPPSAIWLARWLRDNFINSYENLRDGRLYVLYTPLFALAGADGHIHLLLCARSSHPFFVIAGPSSRPPFRMHNRATRSSTASLSGSWPRPRWPCLATPSSSCSTSEVRPLLPPSLPF
jgi:hypothetical protein